MLDRNSAYDYEVLGSPSSFDTAAIANAEYLMRNVDISDSTLSLVGDATMTTSIK